MNRLKSRNLKQLILPGGIAAPMIITEDTPRVSTCDMCSKPICKGDRRLTVAFRLPRPMEMKKGNIFHVKKFYHPACMVKWLGADGTYTPKGNVSTLGSCVDCSDVIPVGNNHYVFVGNRQSYGHICASCASSPRWAFCTYCEINFPRYSTSPILEPEIHKGRNCCDRCQESSHALTVKQRKRLNRMTAEDREKWFNESDCEKGPIF